ncbi:MAG: hypothetical protein MZV65_40535 [Chromatiales bacterium]|nr:hypothetical protein [Chromatiales bacterium]
MRGRFATWRPKRKSRSACGASCCRSLAGAAMSLGAGRAGRARTHIRDRPSLSYLEDDELIRRDNLVFDLIGDHCRCHRSWARSSSTFVTRQFNP